MKRSYYLFAMTGLLLLTGLAEVISGFLLWFILPSGAGRQGLALTFLGLNRHTWQDIHVGFAVVMVLILAVHFLSHLKWIINMTRQIFEQFIGAWRPTKDTATVKVDLG
jgi:hypothetical protein